ncbi:hemicentin-1, partial [Caerostris extrusa]
DGVGTTGAPESACSVTCGEGHPSAPGLVVIINKVESSDGGWSSWSKWSTCSVTCGSRGSIHRYRSCNSPPPAADGKPCEGSSQNTRACKAHVPCPVNGQWSEWSEWSDCSVSCGTGLRMRRRACDNPPPQHGGNHCDRTDAAEVQTHSCTADIANCPVNGGWSEWGDWGPCHTPDCITENAPAYSFRQRSCNAPLPQHKGAMCQGTFLNDGLCAQAINCKVDGNWGEWSEWGCREFVASRKRLCDSPPPSRGGKKCPQKDKDVLIREDDEKRFLEICPKKNGAKKEDGRFDDEDSVGGSGSGAGLGSGDGLEDEDLAADD